MKKSIAETNKYMNTENKRQEMIVDAVYSSAKIEGSKTTKKALRDYYKARYSKKSSQ
ncbi:MAG TPA: hypothetical protein PK926_03395 [Spirochaetota bacterium]|nr:hypothetical protein [Spirochaetota bacterium]HPI88783.1 hypothetical protein [Spirochaetota bacterium]HPR47143.1 hypothetical protein [Spirochaetota bacterium]